MKNLLTFSLLLLATLSFGQLSQDFDRECMTISYTTKALDGKSISSEYVTFGSVNIDTVACVITFVDDANTTTYKIHDKYDNNKGRIIYITDVKLKSWFAIKDGNISFVRETATKVIIRTFKHTRKE